MANFLKGGPVEQTEDTPFEDTGPIEDTPDIENNEWVPENLKKTNKSSTRNTIKIKNIALAWCVW